VKGFLRQKIKPVALLCYQCYDVKPRLLSHNLQTERERAQVFCGLPNCTRN